ncbi:secretin N-terminal domain-containing protein [Candidatus Pelagibacter sp.]|uniref:secretin N-terminal domain-containing protein n=1 Tax=Candidatus Pelagibacter sp. TaxID=2024849 RepID=UPI003F8293C1
MNKTLKFNFILLSLMILLFSGCKSGKPDMAYEQEDGGAVQDIDAFDVEATAGNFKETSEEFSEKTKKIKEKTRETKTLVRRVSLSDSVEGKKSPLEIVDHNSFVKKLNTTEVSLKLNDMDIKSALKLFASLIQRNIIVGDEVGGNITIDFENIKWGSAVYAILDINNLIMIEDESSGLLRVHTKDVYVELEKEKIDRTLEVNKNSITLGSGATALNTDGEQEQLILAEIFRVFNQTSADVIEPIQSLLGDDTTIEITDDVSNNQLLVRGSPEDLNLVEEIIGKVDIERKQVLIEAYLINATDNFNEKFNNNLQLFNSSALANGQNGIEFTGVDTSPGTGVTTTFNTQNAAAFLESRDLPATTTFTNAELSGSAVIMGNIGITRLKALISMSIDQKNSETISNPKLFALDGQTTTLAQGNQLLKEIDGAGSTASTTVTINQNLSMSVTPNIINDNQIELNLNISNSSPGTVPTGVTNTTATNTESLTSIVRVASGEVAVLGGVYKNSKNDNNNRVPFFSKIPILGTFFRSETKEDNKTQLLIFISANLV